jgi:hypothetical protein
MPSVSKPIANGLREIHNWIVASAADASKTLETASTTTADMIETETAVIASVSPSAVEPFDIGKGKVLVEPACAADDAHACAAVAPRARQLADAVAAACAPNRAGARARALAPFRWAMSELLRRSAAGLTLQPIRWALLSEYDGCFSGNELACSRRTRASCAGWGHGRERGLHVLPALVQGWLCLPLSYPVP